VSNGLYSIKFSLVCITNNVGITLFAPSLNFSIRTSYSHFRESSLGSPPSHKNAIDAAGERNSRSLIIKEASEEHFSLYSPALSTAKFPKVRRRTRRHSARPPLFDFARRGASSRPEERDTSRSSEAKKRSEKESKGSSRDHGLHGL